MRFLLFYMAETIDWSQVKNIQIALSQGIKIGFAQSDLDTIAAHISSREGNFTRNIREKLLSLLGANRDLVTQVSVTSRDRTIQFSSIDSLLIALGKERRQTRFNVKETVVRDNNVRNFRPLIVKFASHIFGILGSMQN